MTAATATHKAPTTATKTVRTMLEAFGGYQNVQDPHGVLDAPVRSAHFCIDKDGSTFVHCGGTALISFEPAAMVRSRYYLVIDDDAARRWDAANAKNGHHATKTIGDRGHRPSAVLTITVSA